MRRFASVFARRDKDKDRDSHKADLKRANSSLAPLGPPSIPPPRDSLPATPVLSSGSEPASSSSSNGSASLSLQTPDDDHVLGPPTPTKSKSWTSWLGKKSGTIKRRPSATDQQWVQDVPEWQPKQPVPLLHPPPAGPKSIPPVLRVDTDSDEEDASSSGSDDDESVPLPHSAPALAPPITPTSVAQSRKNLEMLIQNSLVPPLAPSPFAHLPGAPMYPRSSNPPRSLPVRPSMHVAMHKTLLLRRLQHPVVSSQSLVQALDRSILPFASRLPPIPVDPPSPLPWYNDTVPAAAMKLSPSSAGLRRWMSRPCFEERVAVWVPVNGELTSRPVAGSSFAVAELEYSAALDAMIGFGLSPVEEEQPPSPAPAPALAPPVPIPQSQPAAAAGSRNAPFMTVPSPLRNSALKSAVSKSPVSETTPSPTEEAPAPPPVASTTSRVRFVEDDKEDVIPLGYALRLKKRREEKAKFLREEQERRAFEEERAKQEAERMKRENERRRWEEEKRAWENEKRAMEEERKQRIYAEEVAAARLRREQQRAGGGYGASNSSALAASTSTASLRDERNKDAGKYSRPFHDQQGPRRQASEPAVPQRANTPSSSPHTSSPGSSRPPSVAGHQTGTHGRNSSRPPSVHSTSEDVRLNSTSAGKRSSMASLPGKNPSFDRSSTYSMWSASNPTLLMPPVPPVPMYAMDMPLLPPTPPFMLHQYPRPRSQSSSRGSASASASPSRQRNPSNGSSDRVNVQHHQQPAVPRRGSNPSSSPYRPDMAPTHQRRSSDDARRASLPTKASSQHPPSSMRSQSSTSVSRGRPPLPLMSQLQQSPWTAPPLTTSYSQQQLSPAAIINGYATRPPPKRPGARRRYLNVRAPYIFCR
ncbi:hypothetical protein B0H17DRAFT_291156 [Mycena rosella]|uniref:Uncharacterized protein n=1 Tax=Mycena rosella TaxID=1033263 RepID=A0AAD7CV66_MYCRO|nr:hypothetical protein B0H17DRAFT_291156 [Mycena rosella]